MASFSLDQQDRQRQATVQQFSPMARTLAHRIALQPADEDDLVQEGLFALDRALLRTEPETIPAFAATIMRRAMWRYNINHAPDVREQLEANRRTDAPDLGDFHSEGYPYGRHHGGDLEQMMYFDDLEQQCGKEARRIATNLIEPEDEKLCEYLKTVVDKTAKQRMDSKPCETCGVVHLSRPLRISKQQIRKGLGINYAQWYSKLNEIKQFTTVWLAAHKSTLPPVLPGERRAVPERRVVPRQPTADRRDRGQR